MELLPYDEVDPVGVLYLNLLSLDYALTPERVALIRCVDQRPFSFFGLYAVEDGVVAGQVLVYRLTMISTAGPEDVGGMCAVCTHPAFNRRGIATRLFDQAHACLRAAGLRFSTLGTARHRAAHDFYLRQGYDDVFTASSVLARTADVYQDTPIHAERAGEERIYLADDLFARVAAGHLGFARRPAGFLATLVATGDLVADSVWLLWDGDEIAGYALARTSESILTVDDLLMADDTRATGAVTALTRETSAVYVRLRFNRPSMAASLRRAGYPPAFPGWDTFMIRSLLPNASVSDVCAVFGIGTERFLISPVDVT